MDDYLAKPFNLEELLLRVERLLGMLADAIAIIGGLNVIAG